MQKVLKIKVFESEIKVSPSRRLEDVIEISTTEMIHNVRGVIDCHKLSNGTLRHQNDAILIC